uniref:Uncharacterized protein n=1 Tax=Quercus lobata TaxID=97700 RepID=A0A7N2RAZ7_QUELO
MEVIKGAFRIIKRQGCIVNEFIGMSHGLVLVMLGTYKYLSGIMRNKQLDMLLLLLKSGSAGRSTFQANRMTKHVLGVNG